jgi:signal transduction histidine kinase
VHPEIAGDPWQALALPPGRFLRSAWPWRSLGYLAGGVGVGALCLLALVMLGALGVLLTPALIGLGLLVALCLSGVGYAALERRRLRTVVRAAVPDGHRTPPTTGVLAWASTRLREALTWRELGFLALSGVVLWVLELGVVAITVGFPLVAVFGPLMAVAAPESFPAGARARAEGWLWWGPPVGLGAAVVAAYVLALAAGARARVAGVLLTTPVTTLALAEVSRSRARLVDRFEAERMRMERDLHDGVQGRLLGISVQLGLATARMNGTEPAAEPVSRAHQEVKVALAQLRAVVDGIHPRILTDRGVPAAIAELAASCAVPVTTDVALPHRLDVAVEACVYYTVSEAVTNAAKHSGAAVVHVHARCDRRRVRIEITDDGTGGAAVVTGGGLQGLADRADAVGGTLRLASPPGGPTIVALDVPSGPCTCAS